MKARLMSIANPKEQLAETLTVHTLPGAGGTAGASSLLLIEGVTSRLQPLPDIGEWVIGRAQDAPIRLADPTASRRHACLILTPSEVRIVDLDSHNGTYVNGEKVTKPRVLTSRDVVTICGSTLLLQHQATAGRRPVLDVAQLRVCLADEVERTMRYHRPMALLVAELGEPVRPDSGVVALLRTALRRVDLSAWLSPNQLAVVAPEMTRDEVADHAAKILHTLAPHCRSARVGYAQCPSDGGDADTLLDAASAAALSAAPGQLLAADAMPMSRRIGEDELIVADPAMQRVYKLVERLAMSDIPVLITGETGTGKELVARALHIWSQRRAGPLISVNCATLPDALAESLLFGHVRGAFTSATSDHRGFLESASGGTIFLDELGEISLAVQAKLLRALETHKLTPVGATHERAFNARLVAATHRNLDDDIRSGRFREDLLYRIRAGVVVLPPLRARPRELPILVRTFLRAACQRLRRAPMHIADAAMECILRYGWPGNVRQLKNETEYWAATVEDVTVEPWHLSAQLQPPGGPVSAPAKSQLDPSGKPGKRQTLPAEIQQLEKTRIREAINESQGVVREAASLLGIPLRTLYEKLRAYGLHPTDARDKDSAAGKS